MPLVTETYFKLYYRHNVLMHGQSYIFCTCLLSDRIFFITRNML